MQRKKSNSKRCKNTNQQVDAISGRYQWMLLETDQFLNCYPILYWIRVFFCTKQRFISSELNGQKRSVSLRIDF